MNWLMRLSILGVSLHAAATARLALADDGPQSDRDRIAAVVKAARISIEDASVLDADKTEKIRLPTGGERMGAGTQIRMGGASLGAKVLSMRGRISGEGSDPFGVAFDDVSLAVGDSAHNPTVLPLLRVGVAVGSTCETMSEVLGKSGLAERVDQKMRIRKADGRAVIEFLTPPISACLIFAAPSPEGAPLTLRIGSSSTRIKIGAATAAEAPAADQTTGSDERPGTPPAEPAPARPAWNLSVVSVRSPAKVAFQETFGQKETPEAGKTWVEVTAQFKSPEALSIPVTDIRLVDAAGKEWSLVAFRFPVGPFLHADGMRSLELLKVGTNKMPLLFAPPASSKGLRLRVGSAPSVRLPGTSP